MRMRVDRAIGLGGGAGQYELTWFEEPVLGDHDLPGCWTFGESQCRS